MLEQKLQSWQSVQSLSSSLLQRLVCGQGDRSKTVCMHNTRMHAFLDGPQKLACAHGTFRCDAQLHRMKASFDSTQRQQPVHGVQYTIATNNCFAKNTFTELDITNLIPTNQPPTPTIITPLVNAHTLIIMLLSTNTPIQWQD